MKHTVNTTIFSVTLFVAVALISGCSGYQEQGTTYQRPLRRPPCVASAPARQQVVFEETKEVVVIKESNAIAQSTPGTPARAVAAQSRSACLNGNCISQAVAPAEVKVKPVVAAAETQNTVLAVVPPPQKPDHVAEEAAAAEKARLEAEATALAAAAEKARLEAEQSRLVVETEKEVVQASADKTCDQIKDWVAAEGSTLRGLLSEWGDEAGWRVVWNMDRDYTLEAGAVFRGRFTDVSAALLRSFARARPAPKGVFYKGNKVLVISTREDENAE